MTTSEKKILEFIRNFQKENHRPPSLVEISKECGIESIEIIDNCVLRLRGKGLI